MRPEKESLLFAFLPPTPPTSLIVCTKVLVHIVHAALALRRGLRRLRAPPAVDAAVLEVDVGQGVVVLVRVGVRVRVRVRVGVKVRVRVRVRVRP